MSLTIHDNSLPFTLAGCLGVIMNRNGFLRFVAASGLATVALFVLACGGGGGSSQASIDTTRHGFGANTTGDITGNKVHVTTLNDSGAGSLREALGGSNRTVVFDVGGDITLADPLRINTLENITVDGTTALPPGITLHGQRIYVENSNNIILTSFRHRGPVSHGDTRDSSADCVSIYTGCSDILLDHISVSGFEDQGISVADSSHDVTIQNCLIGAGGWPGTSSSDNHQYALFIAFSTTRVSVYHNAFFGNTWRNPQVCYDNTDVNPVEAPEIVADVVNNYINFVPPPNSPDEINGNGSYGTGVLYGAKANVVGNYYHSVCTRTDHAIDIDSTAMVYASGNYLNGSSFTTGDQASAFSVASYAQVVATGAPAAASFVKGNAGCRVGGLDAYDLALMATLDASK